VLDYIFRVLAYEYLDRDDLVHVVDEHRKGADATSAERELSTMVVTPPSAQDAARSVAAQALNNVKVNGAPVNGISLSASKPTVTKHEHNVGSLAEAKADVKKMMGTSADAPACSNCGNITLRNGTCYMCPNCGTTTGCS
jgi:ribonucleoside-diphosphate reductase alpha chain